MRCALMLMQCKVPLVRGHNWFRAYIFLNHVQEVNRWKIQREKNVNRIGNVPAEDRSAKHDVAEVL